MNPEVLQKTLQAGRVAKEALDVGCSLVRDGVTLLEIAEAIENFMRNKGAQPAFPVCLSTDEVAAHYSPTHDDHTSLRRGQVLKIDIGAHIDGYIADTARTVEVGTKNWSQLIKAAEVALQAAIETTGPGVATKSIGSAIERAILSYGCKPIVNLTGHTVERYLLHAGKSIPNVPDHGRDTIELDDTVAIEPFSTNGAGRVDSGKPGNIYRLIRFKKVDNPVADELLRHIESNFKTLPFAERWCYAFDKRSPAHLRNLLRRGYIMSYPTLVEVRGGMVAQAEHTLVVTEGGVRVTTAD